MTEESLLAAIAANTNDAEARAVYADWLDERGDPRGEFLRLEAQLHRGPSRFGELLAQLDPVWLAAVARLCDVVMIDPGPMKIHAIRVVRELTGFGLADAKALVDSPMPRRIRDETPYEEAREVAARFENTGAHVIVMPHACHGIAQPTTAARSRLVLTRFVADGHIGAVASLREVTGCSLQEALALLEAVGRGERTTVLETAAIEVIFAAIARLRPSFDLEIQRI